MTNQQLPECPAGSPAFVGISSGPDTTPLAVTAAGAVYVYGQQVQGMSGQPLAAPIVGISSFNGQNGSYPYWLVAADGGVFAFQLTFPFQGAQYFGSMGGHHLNSPMVGMAPTADGNGYWLVAADGGVFAFGDARFYGSMGGQHLNSPVIGMAPTADGLGYWLVAADGGVFTFGDAKFYGSMGGKQLVSPVVGISATPDGNGYYLAGRDGGVFAFGDALFATSARGLVNSPVIGIASRSIDYQFPLTSAFAASVATTSGQILSLW